MSDAKTKPTIVSVDDFIATVADERRRAEAYVVLEMMREITGDEPVMWGPSIIGFGTCHYRYESGREGDMPISAFSPRKAAMTIYIGGGFELYTDMLARLGKHTIGKSCLYIKKLSDIDLDVLREIIAFSDQHTRTTNP